MQNALISVSDNPSALTAAPFTTAQVILTKQEHIQLKQQANQWHAMWKAACGREQKEQAKNSELISKHKAVTAELNAQITESLYGKLLDTNPITGRWIKPANYGYHCSGFTCRVPYHVPL